MAKRETFIAVGDNHGDMADPMVLKELWKFIKKFKPKHRIHLGDCFDFRSLRQGAKEKERNESLNADIKAGLDFLYRYKPTVFLYGNHEDRLAQTINGSHNALIAEHCQDIDNDIKNFLKQIGCKVIKEYHAEYGVHRLGEILFCHGYTCGKDAVEQHAVHYAESAGGCVIIGHLHRIEMRMGQRLGGVVGFCGGCLCKKSAMDYAKNRLGTSKWGSGWLYGFVEGKKWKVWQAHRVGDKFIYTHGSGTL